MRIAVIIPLAAQVQNQAVDSIFETLLDVYEYVGWDRSKVIRKPFARGQTAMARTFLGKEAVDEGADWLLWIDDDMIPPPGAFAKLMAHQKSICSAAYFSRSSSLLTGEGEYPLCAFDMLATDGKPFDPPPLEPRCLKETQIVGFGFLLMKSTVFTDVWKLSQGIPFRTQVNLTEDVHFLSFARKAGHTVWLDTSLVVGHLKTIAITDKNRDRLAGKEHKPTSV